MTARNQVRGDVSLRDLEAVAGLAQRQMAAENFPVALRLLPRGPRTELATVYRFARFVDDVGDATDLSPARRLALLEVVAAQLRLLSDGAPGDVALTPVRDLAPLVRGGRVPVAPFLDLVEANRVDQRVSEYESFDDLLGYCVLSAAPVGRIVLHLAGAATPERVRRSDAVCAALQVLEHCQDVGEDARAGRIYLPADDRRAVGVAPTDLAGPHARAGLRSCVARQVRRSRELLDEGAPLVASLRGWARPAVAGFVAGGRATADALDAANYDVLAADVRPSRARTVRHALALVAVRR